MGRKSGFKHSQEAKENIRKAKAGKAFSDEHKKNLSKALRGMKHPWVKPPLNRKKAIENLPRKENHWAWKGGVTTEIRKLRNSYRYQQWRKSVFERDGYTCVICGAKSVKGESVYLEADHIRPFAHYPELRFDLSNGRTLCKDCHSKTDTYKAKAKKIFNNQYSKKKPFLKTN